MTHALLALSIVAAASAPPDVWRMLFVADAGPVLFVELTSAGDAASSALARTAEITLVTASTSRTVTHEDRVVGRPPSRAGLPEGPARASLVVERSSVVLTVGESAPLVEVLRAHAVGGSGPTIARTDTLRVALDDALPREGVDEASTTGVIAIDAGVLPGRALVGRGVVPRARGQTVVISGATTVALPAAKDGAFVVAAFEGCGDRYVRTLTAVETDAVAQWQLGPPGCARTAVVQRAEKILVDKRGATHTRGVALTAR